MIASRIFALLAVALLVGCFPDEPRFTVKYRDREALVGGLAGFRACLPVSAREIVVHHDRIRGTLRGTFAFAPADQSVAKRIEKSEVPADSFAERHPPTPSTGEASALRVYRCEEAHFVVAVNEATG